jgi:hypothetical protein
MEIDWAIPGLPRPGSSEEALNQRLILVILDP